MTNLKQRLAALTTLGVVSAVSLLAGGIILGNASADDGEPTPSSGNVLGFAPAEVRLMAGATAGGPVNGCVIAFHGEGAGEAATIAPPPPVLEAIKIEAAGGTEKGFRIVTPDGDLLTDRPELAIAQAIETKPLTGAQIEELKASGALSSVMPKDCMKVNQDGTVTTPEGTVITPDADGKLKLPDGTEITIGKPGSMPFSIEFKAPQP
ncbi:MAG: hypothetical protein AB7P33_09605 [Dehalococcoidia bacterium]